MTTVAPVQSERARVSIAYDGDASPQTVDRIAQAARDGEIEIVGVAVAGSRRGMEIDRRNCAEFLLKGSGPLAEVARADGAKI